MHELPAWEELLVCGALTAAELAGLKEKLLKGERTPLAPASPLLGERRTGPVTDFRCFGRPGVAELTAAIIRGSK